MRAFPEEITLYLTQKCDLHCIMCDADFTVSSPNQLELSFDVIVKTFEQISPKSVTLLGMEPLLYSRIDELLLFLKTRPVYVYLGTNGSFIPHHLETILECVHTVTISIDSHEAKIHDTIRKKEGAFNHTIHGVQSLLDRRNRTFPIVTVICVITQLNYRTLEEFAKRMYKIGVDIVRFNFPRFLSEQLAREQNEVVNRIGHLPSFRRVLPSPEFSELDPEILIKSIEKVKQYPFVIIHGPENKEEIVNYFSEKPTMPSGRCFASKTLSLFPTGDVILCHDFPDVSLGSFESPHFWDQLDGDNVQDLKRGGVFPSCVRCNKYYPAYGGGVQKWTSLLRKLPSPSNTQPLVIH